MSSEESAFEEEEGGGGQQKLVGYNIKRLPWESRKVKKIKKALDKAYWKGLSQRARDRCFPRMESGTLSTRAIPDNLPDWAISN